LTRYEAEGAFSLAIVRNRKLDPAAVWELKSGMLKKSGLLQLHRGGERFADLGGLDALKTYCRRALEPGRPVVPKGVMLVGVPGSGKSCFARALGNETGRPCLTLDVGSLMGSLVGQTEQAIRSALRIADAMAPCVLFIDEVEKALAGQGSDLSGVTTRLFGTLLTWLADHRTPVYTIGTSNDLSKLPSAFTRAGRFNSTWFFDYPDQEQRAKIWPLYLALYGLDGGQPKPDDDRWTGAEIRQCCEEAALQGIPIVEAARYVIPVAVSGAAENEAMRQQAAGKYLDACRGGTFTLSAQRPAAERRAIKRAVTGDPSQN
jgi:SpoVK/Ycf46/Vps4 family AAA+-type ATPase